MQHHIIKFLVVFAIGFLSFGTASAQNGIYRVTNQNELATAAVKQNLRSSMTVSYTEDAENEHAGMQPKEPDTAEAMNVLAEWLHPICNATSSKSSPSSPWTRRC